QRVEDGTTRDGMAEIRVRAPASTPQSLSFFSAGTPCPVPERAALLGGRIGHEAVAFAALVVLRQVFGDRQAIFAYEEKTVAVLVDLHLVAGADPAPLLGLGLLVRVEVAGTERPSQLVHVYREAVDDDLRHFRIGVEHRPAL